MGSTSVVSQPCEKLLVSRLTKLLRTFEAGSVWRPMKHILIVLVMHTAYGCLQLGHCGSLLSVEDAPIGGEVQRRST